MKNFNMKFGGFYGSYHEGYIDMLIENYFSDDEGNFDIPNNIEYRIIFNAYIKEYIESLQEFLKDEFELDIKFHNLRLDSPKEYNFSTDEINCDISNSNMKKINTFFLKDVEFVEYLKEAAKSCDGYPSFWYGSIVNVWCCK